MSNQSDAIKAVHAAMGAPKHMMRYWLNDAGSPVVSNPPEYGWILADQMTPQGPMQGVGTIRRVQIVLCEDGSMQLSAVEMLKTPDGKSYEEQNGIDSTDHPAVVAKRLKELGWIEGLTALQIAKQVYPLLGD